MLWLAVGLSVPFAFLLVTPTVEFQAPKTSLAVYLLAVLGLEIFVGSSREKLPLHRITPAVVLGLLLTPGVSAKMALIVDLLGTLAVALVSKWNNHLIAQAGKALLPASLTAFFLYSRGEPSSQNDFLACEIFVVASVLIQTSRPPFRSDVFLVASYPAVALLLRYLTQFHLTYVLLAVPLLFLLTTVETETLLRYFQLQKKLDHSQSEVRETRKAQRRVEMESRRKGVLLTRKEQQLSLLNGLGREMDGAEAADDLGRFLLKESVHLTGADSAMVVFSDPNSGRIFRLLSPLPQEYWGLKEGQTLPDTIKPGILESEPWPAPIWRGKQAFICCRLGHQGWLFMGKEEKDAFPKFLEEFFSAVGRHAGSAILALRRLTEVRSFAKREAEEKKKVAEQNRNLLLLLESFEGLAEGTLASDQQLLEGAGSALKRMTGADEVVFQAEEPQRHSQGVKVNGTHWASFLFCPGNGASGNLLCLSNRPQAFEQSQIEWCTLLQSFLDKTMENSNLHKELRASYDELQSTQQKVVVSSQWAAAGRLAANAAHELNTPLGAIRIAADHISLYLQFGGDPEPAKESMESLMNSINRCRRVTDRLLLTSRPVDSGTDSAKPQVHELGVILKDAMASVRPYLRAAKIKLVEPQTDLDARVLCVMEDLYWAIVNLLKNAIDAQSDYSDPDKRLAIQVRREEKCVRITVADNGPGVPPELQKRLFEPFFTTKKLGQGNGLGLSLSRTNLRRWGGDIEFRQTSEGGATFVLKAPLAP